MTPGEKKLCKEMLWNLLMLEGKAAGKSLADEFGVDARVFSRWKQSGACPEIRAAVERILSRERHRRMNSGSDIRC